MSKQKRHKPEEIASILKQHEAGLTTQTVTTSLGSFAADQFEGHFTQAVSGDSPCTRFRERVRCLIGNPDSERTR